MNKQIDLVAQFETKSIEENGDIIIVGTASSVRKDLDGDVILPDAFSRGGMSDYLNNPAILAFHDRTKVVGKMIDHSIESDGLHIKAKISKHAKEIYNLVKDGYIQAFSVGFQALAGDYSDTDDTFYVKEAKLLEVSLVSIPANPNALFSVVKSLGNKDTEELKKLFTQEELNMDKDNKEIKSLKDDIAALTSLIVEKEDKATKAAPATSKDTGAEKLIKELEARFQDEKTVMADTIKEMKSDIEEKASDLKAIRDSKMSFGGENKSDIKQKEIDDAVLVAKMLGVKASQTKYGKDLMEKAPFVLSNPGSHLTQMDENWENSFSTNIYNDIRGRQVMEPLFKTVNMTTASLTLPLNSSNLDAEWVSRAAFENQAAREGGVDNGSTAAAKKTLLDDIVLVAGKLASKEYIGYEETEDTFLPIVEVIRDAVIRRMSKSSDIALLRGDKGTASAGGGNYPFMGVINLTTKATTASAKVTVSDLAAGRRLLGLRGLNPSDVIYVVSETAYYDLLDDKDFRTTDLVDSNATILTGQIGSCNGSRVIVSSAFEAAATGKPVAVALDASNFLVGSLRGLMVERDRDIISQSNVLVATRRFTFAQLFAGEGAVVINAA